jgi:ubiquinone/menaquinone biosynthesis C-methylase UbiE
MRGVPNAYEMLASEYYDPIRHPTCANFTDSSKLITATWLRHIPNDGPVCEVGCGMSLAAELLTQAGRNINELFLVDSSLPMLMHSERWTQSGAKLILADAAQLPFADNSIRACIASLGDPYNDPEFWDEMARVVKPLGYIIFTAPSFEWASRYRNQSQDCSAMEAAEFLLPDDTKLLARSIIRAADDQTAIVERTGRLRIEGALTVTYSQVPSKRLSSKLLLARPRDLPVVTGFLIRRVEDSNS